MVKVDRKYLDDITKYYRDVADAEIFKLGENPDKEKVKSIEQKFGTQAIQNIAYILSIGPKRQFKMGVALDPSQWRQGYTKPTIEKRKEERRRKNKAARISRRNNRRV